MFVVRRYSKWTNRLFEEFWAQGDKEKENFGSVAVSFMDRESCDLPQCQTGFLGFFVLPLFHAAAAVFPTVREPLKQIEANQAMWERKVLDREKKEEGEQIERDDEEEGAPAVEASAPAPAPAPEATATAAAPAPAPPPAVEAPAIEAQAVAVPPKIRRSNSRAEI